MRSETDRTGRPVQYSEKKYKWMGFKMIVLIYANAGIAFPMT